jgi:hypothetical protein
LKGLVEEVVDERGCGDDVMVSGVQLTRIGDEKRLK